MFTGRLPLSFCALLLDVTFDHRNVRLNEWGLKLASCPFNPLALALPLALDAMPPVPSNESVGACIISSSSAIITDGNDISQGKTLGGACCMSWCL